jgi:hypothetical protein
VRRLALIASFRILFPKLVFVIAISLPTYVEFSRGAYRFYTGQAAPDACLGGAVAQTPDLIAIGSEKQGQVELVSDVDLSFHSRTGSLFDCRSSRLD